MGSVQDEFVSERHRCETGNHYGLLELVFILCILSVHTAYLRIVLITFRVIIAFFCASLIGLHCSDPPESPPNIILIMADDLGYETLGVNGGTSYETPRLDALAREGMRFTNAYSNPLCTPSRVQIMTGKYNSRNYIGFGLLDPEERTFGHLLRESGYATAVVGKWQLYGNAHQRELAGRGGAVPEEAGFDAYSLWQVKDRGYRFKDPTLDITGAPVQQYPGAYGPDMFVDYLESFTARHTDQPFFVYFPMVLTHDPFRPTPDDAEYDTLQVDGVNDPAYFASNMAYMDKMVGRIVDHLDRTGLRENTLLLFTGDNGTDRDVTSRMGEREIRGDKGYPTRYGTHVPLIANWPARIPAGQVNDNLIDFTDFLPTLMETAGRPVPHDFFTDGLSFFPQLVGEADTVRSWVYCYYAPEWGRFENARFAHNGVWKLYDTGALYHTVEDPLEQHPVDDAELDAATLQLKAELQAVLDRLP